MGERTITRSERKRRAILSAAREAFLEKGFTETSVDEIAQRAGASKRTLYNHFPSKKSLFLEIVHLEKMGDLSWYKPYEPGKPVDEQLKTIVLARADSSFLGPRIRLIRMLIGEILRTPKLIEDLEAHIRRVDESLAPWIEAAIEDGALIPVRCPRLVSDLFWSGIGSRFWRQLLVEQIGRPPGWEEFVDEWIATFLARYAA